MKKILCVLLLLALLCPAWAEVLCEDGVAITEDLLVEYGYAYYSRDEVALYLHAFCELPVNFITKKEVFIDKIPKFLGAFENIDRNGHVKLHLVADLC